MRSNAALSLDLTGRASANAPAAKQAVPVFRIDADQDGSWHLRKEGSAIDAAFPSRAAAMKFLRDLAGSRRSFRVLVSTAKKHGDSKLDLRQRLAWADRLASAARVSPSRIRLLADWIRGRAS